MGLFDKLFGKKETPEPAPAPEVPKVKKPRKPRIKPEAPKLSAKETATLNNEPYVNILKMDVDPEDINSGSFELDWNDKFILNLVKAGYKIRDDDTDSVIADRWFQTVCRNVALELYEQQQADPENRYKADMRVVKNKDLGDGRTEVS
jgi:hypothetical protein